MASRVVEASGAKIKAPKRNYEMAAQEAHDAKDCAINEKEHARPDFDCGHTVATGPATGMQDPDGDGILEKAPSQRSGPGVK